MAFIPISGSPSSRTTQSSLSSIPSAVDDDESVFVDASSRSQSPAPLNDTVDTANNDTFNFSNFNITLGQDGQDSFNIDDLDSALSFDVKKISGLATESSQLRSHDNVCDLKTGDHASLSITLKAGSESSDHASLSTTLEDPTTPVAVPVAPSLVVEETTTTTDATSANPSSETVDQEPISSSNGDSSTFLNKPLDKVDALEGFQCSPELLAMKKLLEEVGGNQAPSMQLEQTVKEAEAAHYGTKPGHFETMKIHFPTSEGVSEVSERANE